MMQHIETLKPDAKGRITLGNLARGVSSFKVSLDEKQRIVLEPYVEILAREMWLYQNPEALASVKRGIAQAAVGNVLPSTEDFSAFADDEGE